MNRFESFLSNKLLPLSSKMQENNVLGALTEGFIRTSPATIGSAFILILANFPIQGWLDWLQKIKIADSLSAVANASIGIMALLAVYNIAFAYAKRLGCNSQNAGLISLASYFILIPQTITTFVKENGEWVSNQIGAVKFDYLGGQGIFIGMLVALLITKLYSSLSKRKFTIKLPESVPPMVADSLAPTFIVTIIFALVCAVRIAFSFTGFHDVFNFITSVISAPINSVMANPLTMIMIQVLLSFLWFFGIHNAVLSGPLSAVTLTMITTNIQAFTSGDPLPYGTAFMIYSVCGAAGNTMGLIICLMTSKSKRYREMFKLGALPTVFNITEPLVFGLPIILNPLYFFPMVLSPLISGFVSWGLSRLFFPFTITRLLKISLDNTWLCKICSFRRDKLLTYLYHYYSTCNADMASICSDC
ncbi:PTS sugar transporter subunit IIC [Listeria aquatica]|uniref:PTS sugar transporter subunit IIC n=1 Tax=Listeria aquatica TaxID=1494960 RepID=UPI0031F5A95C